MSVQIDKCDYRIDPVSCPLKEHSITNYVFRPIKKDRKGRKKHSNLQSNANGDEQVSLVTITPLELSESANISYQSYQSALVSATESLLGENDNISVDDIIQTFSNLKFFDPCTQTFKSPESTSASHIEFIFKNSDYFSKRYTIESNIVSRK